MVLSLHSICCAAPLKDEPGYNFEDIFQSVPFVDKATFNILMGAVILVTQKKFSDLYLYLERFVWQKTCPHTILSNRRATSCPANL